MNCKDDFFYPCGPRACNVSSPFHRLCLERLGASAQIKTVKWPPPTPSIHCHLACCCCLLTWRLITDRDVDSDAFPLSGLGRMLAWMLGCLESAGSKPPCSLTCGLQTDHSHVKKQIPAKVPEILRGCLAALNYTQEPFFWTPHNGEQNATTPSARKRFGSDWCSLLEIHFTQYDPLLEKKKGCSKEDSPGENTPAITQLVSCFLVRRDQRQVHVNIFTWPCRAPDMSLHCTYFVIIEQFLFLGGFYGNDINERKHSSKQSSSNELHATPLCNLIAK